MTAATTSSSPATMVAARPPAPVPIPPFHCLGPLVLRQLLLDPAAAAPLLCAGSLNLLQLASSSPAPPLPPSIMSELLENDFLYPRARVIRLGTCPR